MFYLVYKTTNLVNGKFYIGVHRTEDKEDSYLGSGIKLQRAIKKYGKENFKREILAECSSEEEMFQKEKELIVLDPTLSYNLCEGGVGGNLGKDPWNKGKKGLQKWTEKQRNSPPPRLGVKERPETTKKRIESFKRNGKTKGRIPWNKGKKGSQVAWNKGLKGTLSPDQLLKMQEARKKKLEQKSG